MRERVGRAGATGAAGGAAGGGPLLQGGGVLAVHPVSGRHSDRAARGGLPVRPPGRENVGGAAHERGGRLQLARGASGAAGVHRGRVRDCRCFRVCITAGVHRGRVWNGWCFRVCITAGVHRGR
eukprot:1143966-Prorocentrum_minimum.AAC.1